MVKIYEKDYEDIAEVDSKLVKLSQELKAQVITNDFNLNKVAELQGIKVLNINELANALKPIVLPGEEMTVQVIKDGKETGQGIGYLDDGTMIVVENGRKYIGQIITVLVTSVLQTAAGRMIFVPKDRKKYNSEHQALEVKVCLKLLRLLLLRKAIVWALQSPNNTFLFSVPIIVHTLNFLSVRKLTRLSRVR